MRCLTVRRRAHRRRGYHRESGTYTHPTQVPGVIFRVRDRGRPGRGPLVITNLKRGAMTSVAVQKGYIAEGQGVSDIPKSRMGNFGRDLARVVGPTRAGRMVNAQLVLRKNQGGGFKDRLLVARDAIRRQNRVLRIHR